VPAAVRGQAFATFGAAIQGASMIGYLAGGALLEGFAPRPLVAAAGIAGLAVVAPLMLLVRRSVRQDGVTPSRPVLPTSTVADADLPTSPAAA
jgi:MFS family permease